MKEKVVRQMIEDEGLEIDSLEVAVHTKVYVKNANGDKKLVVFPRSPGDRRNEKNLRALLRRFAKES